MLTHEQNELLTRVEDDAPMGRLLREHYWVPALLELSEPCSRMFVSLRPGRNALE